MARRWLAPALVTVLVARSAAAQPQAVLANLGSTATGGTIEGRADFTTQDLLDDERMSSIYLAGQYLAPAGFGGYLTLPLIFGEAVEEGDRNHGTGNLGLGAIRVRHATPDLDLFVKAGVAIELSRRDRKLAPDALIVPQPTEAIPSGFGHALRASAGLRTTRDGFQYGALVGLDLVLDDQLTGDTGWIASLAGSVGYARSRVGVSLGVTFLKVFAATNFGLGDDFTLGAKATVDLQVSATVNVSGTIGVNPFEAISGTSAGLGVRVQI